MIDRVRGAAGSPISQAAQSAPSTANPDQASFGQTSFGQMLRQVQEENVPQRQEPQSAEQSVQSVINFSKHAMNRAEERGIELTPALMEQLAGSVEKAQEKGAKNILAFNATQAFIINVPYGRVITTMNQDEMKENIFTNIDGAVLI